MSEKEVTEEQISAKLNEIILGDPDKTHRLFAKLIFNLQFDLDEFKIEISNFLKKLKIEEGKPEPEEIKMGPEDIKTIDDNLEDCLRDPSRYS